jgi:kynurenine formamidase
MSRAVAVVACALAALAVLWARGGAGDVAAQGRALTFPRGDLVDLSHPFNRRTIYWPTAKRFRLTEVAEGRTEGGYYYSAYNYEGAEHGGTHLDAPIHFSRGGRAPHELPLSDLTGNGIVVDVSAAAAANPDYLVSVADLEAWEREHGRIARNSIVLLRTGQDRFYPDAARYLGTADRGADAVPKLHFPGLDPAAARWLVRERRIEAVGLDTASIDRGQSTDFLAHRVLAAAQVPIFENLTNLDELPAEGFLVVALPMKIEGGSGGPLRAMAITP